MGLCAALAPVEEPRAARAARDEHRELVSPDRCKRGARLLRASTARDARTDDARLRSANARGRRGRWAVYIRDPNGYTVELYRD